VAGRNHTYTVTVEWRGNRGGGTASPSAYDRDHVITGDLKHDILGSSDPSFRGDPARWNPEELLLASLSACHKLWYLGLCAASGVVVQEYVDRASGTMAEQADGAGQFTEVTLRPEIILAPGSDDSAALALHERAHAMCFVARSVNFPVHHEATIRIAA